MTVNFLDVIYEGLFGARMVVGLFVLSAIYFKKNLRLPLWAVIAIAVAVILLGASFNLILNAAKDFLNQISLRILVVFWYIGILIVIFGAFKLCVNVKIGKLAFVFTLAGLTESQLFGFMRLFIDMKVFELRVNTPLSISIEILVSLLYHTAIYFIFSMRRWANLIGEHLDKSPVTIYCLLTIALNMFLRLSSQAVYEDLIGRNTAWIVNFDLLIIPFILSVLDITFVADVARRHENEMLDLMLSEREKQYALSLKNVEEVNKQAHDLKRKIRALELVSDNEKQEVFTDINNAVELYDTQVKTNNIALTTVLSEKKLYCVQHGITFSAMPTDDDLSYISQIDIYNMLSNMLDNAVEAVEKLSDKDKRVISFTMRKGNRLVISTDNYFDGDVKINNGEIATKKTGGVHGYGLKSIRATAEKYGGSFDTQVDGDVFVATITLPNKD